MSNRITTIDGVEYSDGPDGDCCCDPCSHFHPPERNTLYGCCRCVPRLLCMTFTPDSTTLECCRSLSIAIPPFFAQGPETVEVFNPTTMMMEPIQQGALWRQQVSYVGTINGITVSVVITRNVRGGPCYWTVSIDGQYVFEQIEIDHVNVTCLTPPEVVITGVTDSSGCVGTITFAASDMAKVPFRHVINQPALQFFTPTWGGGEPQCNCTSVPQYLCVQGVRHRGELREAVQFTWNEALGDRWSYLPCNGNITTDQEHIYLRGDHYGNCYLEFDFEQTGSTTNDWAVPPNTLGTDIHEIRDGMVAIESCGCDIYAHSVVPEIATIEFPTSRYVYITAGICGCWQYVCGKCRCVSKRVCVSGMIDGNTVIADGIWDGEAWAVAADGYAPAFRLRLTSNGCGECVIQPEGDFSIPFAESDALECGEAMTAESFSVFDPYFPTTFNWLWVTAAPCDCLVSPCFLCLEERCGGMPDTIYYEITTRALFVASGYEEFCNITIPLAYFKRFFGPSRQLVCGYIGYATVSCAANEHRAGFTRIIRVSVLSGGPGAFNYQVDYAELSAGPLVFGPMLGNNPRPNADIISCDPFVADTGWFSMPVNCRWGCADIPRSTQPTEMREMFVE